MGESIPDVSIDPYEVDKSKKKKKIPYKPIKSAQLRDPSPTTEVETRHYKNKGKSRFKNDIYPSSLKKERKFRKSMSVPNMSLKYFDTDNNNNDDQQDIAILEKYGIKKYPRKDQHARQIHQGTDKDTT